MGHVDAKNGKCLTSKVGNISHFFLSNESYNSYAMPLPISIPKTAEQLPLDNLLALTRAAFGLGLGMLVADKIKRPVRQAAAIALVSVGALAAVPLLVKVALERINRPESERGSRARLRSIRGDSGYSSETDIY
jgi:hypothetical protein